MKPSDQSFSADQRRDALPLKLLKTPLQPRSERTRPRLRNKNRVGPSRPAARPENRGIKLIRAKVGVAALLAAFSVCVSNPSFAISNQTMILGGGTASCGAWTDARQHERVLAQGFLEWALGYISETNVEHHVNVIDGSDAEGVAAWLDNYCAKHPLDTLALATQTMIAEIVAKDIEPIMKEFGHKKN